MTLPVPGSRLACASRILALERCLVSPNINFKFDKDPDSST